MNKLLIVVDYQNDFVSPDGHLSLSLDHNVLCKTQKLAPILQALIDKWHSRSDPVLFLLSDYNLKNYKGAFLRAREASPYGGAAITGSWGHDLYKLKSNPTDKILVKNYFDGFQDSLLESSLKEIEAKEAYFCGINTDVCVFHTAIGALTRGYNTYLIEDATDTPSSHKKVFVDQLKRLGVQITNSKDC